MLLPQLEYIAHYFDFQKKIFPFGEKISIVIK